MKDFALDSETGDIVIYNNDIEIVNGDALTCQTVRQLVGSNRGEWFLDKNLGVNFQVILSKNSSEESIKNEILQALRVFDETFYMEKFHCGHEGRRLTVEFLALNENGQAVRGEKTWQ